MPTMDEYKKMVQGSPVVYCAYCMAKNDESVNDTNKCQNCGRSLGNPEWKRAADSIKRKGVHA